LRPGLCGGRLVEYDPREQDDRHGARGHDSPTKPPVPCRDLWGCRRRFIHCGVGLDHAAGCLDIAISSLFCGRAQECCCRPGPTPDGAADRVPGVMVSCITHRGTDTSTENRCHSRVERGTQWHWGSRRRPGRARLGNYSAWSPTAGVTLAPGGIGAGSPGGRLPSSIRPFAGKPALAAPFIFRQCDCKWFERTL
jgi:hypothetical protein